MPRSFTSGKVVPIKGAPFLARWEVGGLARHYQKHPAGKHSRCWGKLYGRQISEQEYEERSYATIEDARLVYRARNLDDGPEWVDRFVDLELIETITTDHRKARLERGGGAPSLLVRTCFDAHYGEAPDAHVPTIEVDQVAQGVLATGEKEQRLREYWLNRTFVAECNDERVERLNTEK